MMKFNLTIQACTRTACIKGAIMKLHFPENLRNLGPMRTLAAALCLLFIGAIVQAQQLTLSKAPPSGGGTQPRPNVIVTVDDSGSMDLDVNGEQTDITANKKITLLKNALKATFGDTTKIPDGRIRLAWQAMHDNGNFISGNGASTIKLGAKNSIKLFSGSTAGTHRQNFNLFVDGLKPGDFTPSLSMMQNVFDYMNAPEDPASPWADDPTVSTKQTTPYSACRRTFHVFMTDGLWNVPDQPSCTLKGKRVGTTEPPVCSNSSYSCPPGYTSNSNNSSAPANACRKGKKGNYVYSALEFVPNTSIWSTGDRVPNGDGVSIAALPDGDGTTAGTPYNTSSPMSRIYRDAYGDNKLYASTLSDFAFNNWARDFQDGNPGVTQTNSAGATVSGNTQNIPNTLSPIINVDTVETVIDSASNKTDLSVFWNPKNDPATWQHITQYMIGFGKEATSWGTNPQWDSTSNSTYGAGGDYAKLVNGTVSWPDVQVSSTGNSITARAAELWHSAINGRGKYIPAVNVGELTQAFEDILDDIGAATTSPLITVTTSSSTLRSGTLAYVAGYESKKWSGQLVARALDPVNGSVMAGETWNAVEKLDARTTNEVASRVVISSQKGASPSFTDTGFSWTTYSSLPGNQQTPLNKNSSGNVDNNGQNRVDYIRGDRSKELGQTGGIFRSRGSRFGDIVNSNIWFTGKPASGYTANNYAAFRGTGGKGSRTPMIYLGANDGMLHGVVAMTTTTVAGGTELLAYIPQGIAEGKLRNLTDTNYLHDYFVDGTPFTGDAFITTPTNSSTAAWATVLVGTLGAGGKGYFILDATDPVAFTTSNAAYLVIKDTTGGTVDADLGVITSQPVADDAISNKSRQIVQMNNGRWAVVLGNGYNSVNEAPVLFIQYLDGDKSIVKISPCDAPIDSTACSFKGGNGLSVPQLIDLNGDGRVDVAYAGDLKGNLWKFNLTATTASSWSVGFNKQPFFVAKGHSTVNARPSATVAQAITSAPYWMAHPLGGIMVSVGTGRNLTDADQSSTAVDSYYALWDNSSFVSSGGGVTITDGTPINTTSSTSLATSGLVRQTITGNVTDTGIVYYSSSNNAVSYSTNSSSTQRGWYLDLELSTNLELSTSLQGERILLNTRLFSGETIIVTSTVPKTGATASESCTFSSTAETNYFYLLNMFSGKQPGGDPLEVGTVTTGNTYPNIITMPGGDTAIVEGDGKKYVVKSDCDATKTCSSTPMNLPKSPGRRVNWRQKQ
jgi:type IV pilus assembly protein PilY1